MEFISLVQIIHLAEDGESSVYFQLQGEEGKGLMCYGCVEAMEDQAVFQVTTRRTKW